MSPTPNKAATQAPPYPTMIRILPSTVAELHRTRLHGWPDPDCVTTSTCRRHKSNVQVSAGLDRRSLRLRARDHSIILHSIILPNHPANHPAMHSRHSRHSRRSAARALDTVADHSLDRLRAWFWAPRVDSQRGGLILIGNSLRLLVIRLLALRLLAIQLLAIATCVVLSGWTGSDLARAQELKISHQFKADVDARDRAARMLVAETLKRAPHLKLSVHPDSSLKIKPVEQLDAMAAGSLAMSVYPMIYGASKAPELAITMFP